MKVDTIFHAFERLFPDLVGDVIEYERFGSRMIEIIFKHPESPNLYFLYNNDQNWNLGTKPHRRKPEGGEK